MKHILIIGLLLVGSWAHAGLYSQTFSPNTTITAGNPVGTTYAAVFNADPITSETVVGMTIVLNITGGYSGGFYLSLTAPNGATTVTLFNTPGTSTSGMNITLQDGSPAISSGSNLSSGTYAPSQALSGFNGQTADGTWTLYFADLASGGGNPTLNSFTLTMTTVPEPINMALAAFGGLLAIPFIIRRIKTGRFTLSRE